MCDVVVRLLCLMALHMQILRIVIDWGTWAQNSPELSKLWFSYLKTTWFNAFHTSFVRNARVMFMRNLGEKEIIGRMFVSQFLALRHILFNCPVDCFNIDVIATLGNMMDTMYAAHWPTMYRSQAAGMMTEQYAEAFALRIRTLIVWIGYATTQDTLPITKHITFLCADLRIVLDRYEIRHTLDQLEAMMDSPEAIAAKDLQLEVVPLLEVLSCAMGRL